MRPWLAASDVLVFPSYREGFPNVVIEAGAMDLPSIVSDINGCNEIIVDGENGIIVPSKMPKHYMMQWSRCVMMNKYVLKWLARRAQWRQSVLIVI